MKYGRARHISSDGILYGVYKKLWTIAGPVILDAWNHSCVIGEQPLSHNGENSVLTLVYLLGVTSVRSIGFSRYTVRKRHFNDFHRRSRSTFKS